MEFRPAAPRSPRWLWFFIGLTAVAIVVPMFMIGQVTRGMLGITYEVTPAKVIIHYSPGPVEIPLPQIAEAYILEHPTEVRRLNGTAVRGAYQGRWSFAETGRLLLYATATERVVILRTATDTYGVTPADPAGFITAMQLAAPKRFEPVRGASPWRTVLPLILLPLLLIPTVGIMLYYVRLPHSIRYVLEDDAVVVHGGRVHLRLPYGQITRVEGGPLKGAPMRVYGAALPGLYWGNFTWRAAGGKLKLLATRYKPIVLVQTNALTVGVSPEEHDRFVTELMKRTGHLASAQNIKE